MDESGASRNGRRNGWSRPVSIPADVGDARVVKAAGVIELPLHVSWSGPRRRWNLDDRRQRAQVYEVVLTEGTDDDVRFIIDVDDDDYGDLRAWAEELTRGQDRGPERDRGPPDRGPGIG